ncbi:PhzF family phenazine biosynthesis protein [Thiomicrorhabdus sp.]|uniref:PhzF family phenazine biosynthesis protein n=1 Tax=Thiomicrorhabdus sp. TaxID=2039724 RepID=UPI0029C6A948|nr:PhzF family phenazine biosynthesis protein [Thiomicrorhabdus sp.]
MKLPIYQVDAFADRAFEGNPAAVCILDSWLCEETMQAIAAENNLSETAFVVPYQENAYQIRWFTPTAEVDLCGHATLAAAYVLFECVGLPDEEIRFWSRSGWLRVCVTEGMLQMNFPAQQPESCPLPTQIQRAFGIERAECFQHQDYLVVLDDESLLRDLTPDFQALMDLDLRGVILTAPSKDFDFVCRFFAPRYGINEDPVTGSAFTQLAPFWAERLSKTDLTAKQVSRRGGKVYCRWEGERVFISGRAALYLRGEIEIQDV